MSGVLWSFMWLQGSMQGVASGSRTDMCRVAALPFSYRGLAVLLAIELFRFAWSSCDLVLLQVLPGPTAARARSLVLPCCISVLVFYVSVLVF
jgi:hypothetical protein